MKERQSWIDILSSVSGVLYIGVTNKLERRMLEHRETKVSGFSAKYNTTRLAHDEEFPYINDGIAWEKELKGWRREKKVAPINADNPRWRDLAAEWFEE